MGWKEGQGVGPRVKRRARRQQPGWSLSFHCGCEHAREALKTIINLTFCCDLMLCLHSRCEFCHVG